MVTDLVGVDHIRPAFGFLTMILGVGVTIGTPIGGMYRSRAPNECVLEIYFLYFSSKTYVVGTQKNRLQETVHLSTQNTYLN